jgi:hypothetical protein
MIETVHDLGKETLSTLNAGPRWPRFSSIQFTQLKAGAKSFFTMKKGARDEAAHLPRSDNGATSIDTGISVAILAVVNTLGTDLTATFSSISN